MNFEPEHTDLEKYKKTLAKLIIVKKELTVQNEEKEKRAAELVIANKDLTVQNEEKEKRAAELVIANKELTFQNKEKEKRAAELATANKELILKNEENDKHSAELRIAYDEIERKDKLIEIQKAYYFEKKLLEITLLSIGDAVITMDQDRNVLLINHVAEELTGWTQKQARGVSIYKVFNIINEITRKKDADVIDTIIKTGQIQHLDEHTLLVRKDGRELPIGDSASPIMNEANEIVGVVLVFRDYTEKREYLKNIEYLSFHDALTGLFNRRFYEEELTRLDVQKNLPIGLIMSDVNGLKLINDSFGHDTGDLMLKKTAEAMKAGCRPDDIVARLGGDEFVIILPRSNAEDVENVVKRIKALINKENVNDIKISLSFGSAVKKDEKHDIRSVFKKAENLMYRSKIRESSKIKHQTIDLITGILFGKNNRELLHSQNVSKLCIDLSKKLGLNDEDVELMRLAGLLHDIGKIGIEDKIVNKTTALNSEEFAEIKKHPEIGYRILSSVSDYSEIALYVFEHQEKWNGTGYPQKLKGKDILIGARIIAIAEAYDEMTAKRLYGKVLNHEDAIKEIVKYAGTQFDPDIVKIFIES